MNKCISLAVPLRATTGKRSVHREKWHPRKRAYISSATTNKTLFPGENTRARNGRERGGSSVHSIPGIPGAAIQAAELAEKYGRNVALTRESSAIHCRRPWILMDLSSPPPPPPAGSFRPERCRFALCNLHARIVLRYIRDCTCSRKTNPVSPRMHLLFSLSFPLPYMFYYRLNSRSLLRDMVVYNAIVRKYLLLQIKKDKCVWYINIILF